LDIKVAEHGGEKALKDAEWKAMQLDRKKKSKEAMRKKKAELERSF